MQTFFLVGVGLQGIKWPQNITPPSYSSHPKFIWFSFLNDEEFQDRIWSHNIERGVKRYFVAAIYWTPSGDFFLIGKGVQDILCIHVYMVVKYWTFYTIWFSFLLEKVFGILYNHKTILFDLKWGSPLKFLILR